MVYANYTPAKLPTVATDLERCVYSLTNLDTLEVIGKLLYNAACTPKEDKYRRIKLTNKTVKAAIVDVSGAVDVLLQMGWVQEQGEEPALIIPAGKFMSMKEVRMIEVQKDRARKEARTATMEVVRRAGQAAA